MQFSVVWFVFAQDQLFTSLNQRSTTRPWSVSSSAFDIYHNVPQIEPPVESSVQRITIHSRKSADTGKCLFSQKITTSHTQGITASRQALISFTRGRKTEARLESMKILQGQSLDSGRLPYVIGIPLYFQYKLTRPQSWDFRDTSSPSSSPLRHEPKRGFDTELYDKGHNNRTEVALSWFNT